MAVRTTPQPRALERHPNQTLDSTELRFGNVAQGELTLTTTSLAVVAKSADSWPRPPNGQRPRRKPQAAKAPFAVRRRIAPPTRPSPPIIIAQLAGSGTAPFDKVTDPPGNQFHEPSPEATVEVATSDST